MRMTAMAFLNGTDNNNLNRGRESRECLTHDGVRP